MRTTSRWRFGALIVLVTLVAWLIGSRLPDTAQAQPVVPDPADCQLPLLTKEEVLALAPTPAPPSAEYDLPTQLPSGEPADDATQRPVRDAIDNFYACANAGMPIETISLFSSRFLAQPAGSIELDFSATVTPEPEQERAEIVAVWNIQRLSDGRVAATVTIRAFHERTRIMIFIQDHDRWLLDELVTAIMRGDQRIEVADIVGSPVAATPAP